MADQEMKNWRAREGEIPREIPEETTNQEQSQSGSGVRLVTTGLRSRKQTSCYKTLVCSKYFWAAMAFIVLVAVITVLCLTSHGQSDGQGHGHGGGHLHSIHLNTDSEDPDEDFSDVMVDEPFEFIPWV